MGAEYKETLLFGENRNFTNTSEAMDDGIYIVSKNFDLQFVNQTIINNFGDYKGRKCYNYFYNRKSPCPWCKNSEVFKGKTVHGKSYAPRFNRTYDVIETPIVNYDNGISKLKMIHNITERLKREEEIRNKTEDLYFINELNKAVNQGKSFKEILKILVGGTKRIFSCYGATLYLLDRDGKYLEMQNLAIPPKIEKSIEKLIGIKIPDVKIPLNEESLYGKVLKERKPHLINDKTTILKLISEFTENKILNKMVPDIYKVLGIHSVLIVPLVSRDKAIGILDISRKEPFTESEAKRLKIVSRQISSILVYKKIQEALAESEEKYHSIIESTYDFVTSVDLYGRFTYVNKVCQQLFGVSQKQCVGLSAFDFVYPEDRERTINWFRECLEKNISHSAIENRQVNRKTDEVKNIQWTSHFHYNSGEGVNSIVSIGRDITERIQAERKIQKLLLEKELLLKEVHHRIKNNMITIRSLLSIQSNNIKIPEAVSSFQDAISRIDSMGVLYDKLYRSDNYEQVSIKEYLTQLTNEIVEMFPQEQSVLVETRIDDFYIGTKLVFSLGLIINELITNAMKYAFEGRKEGLLRISVSKNKNHIILIFEDDGIGISEPAGKEDKGFGITLINTLVDQIEGSCKINKINGTKYTIEFNV